MNAKELKYILQEGESYLVEFKERVNKSLARELTAFANASGGRIFLGVNNQGNVKGIKNTNTLRSQIQDIANNCDPRILIRIKTVRCEGVKLLVVSVDESLDKLVRCSKGFFLREGPNSQKLTRNEILALAASAGKFKFDMQPCRSFNCPEDFEDTKWRHFLDKTGIVPPENRKDLLMNLGFA